MESGKNGYSSTIGFWARLGRRFGPLIVTGTLTAAVGCGGGLIEEGGASVDIESATRDRALEGEWTLRISPEIDAELAHPGGAAELKATYRFDADGNFRHVGPGGADAFIGRYEARNRVLYLEGQRPGGATGAAVEGSYFVDGTSFAPATFLAQGEHDGPSGRWLMQRQLRRGGADGSKVQLLKQIQMLVMRRDGSVSLDEPGRKTVIGTWAARAEDRSQRQRPYAQIDVTLASGEPMILSLVGDALAYQIYSR